MYLELESLPDNELLSKQQVLALVGRIEEKHRTQKDKFQSQIDYLEEQLRLLRNELFGRKSEKAALEDLNQLHLFSDSSTRQATVTY